MGTWGDADPINITDWVPVSVAEVPASQSWDASRLACTNAVVGMELQLLTAKVIARKCQKPNRPLPPLGQALSAAASREMCCGG